MRIFEKERIDTNNVPFSSRQKQDRKRLLSSRIYPLERLCKKSKTSLLCMDNLLELCCRRMELQVDYRVKCYPYKSVKFEYVGFAFFLSVGGIQYSIGSSESVSQVGVLEI